MHFQPSEGFSRAVIGSTSFAIYLYTYDIYLHIYLYIYIYLSIYLSISIGTYISVTMHFQPSEGSSRDIIGSTSFAVYLYTYDIYLHIYLYIYIYIPIGTCISVIYVVTYTGVSMHFQPSESPSRAIIGSTSFAIYLYI